MPGSPPPIEPDGWKRTENQSYSEAQAMRTGDSGTHLQVAAAGRLQSRRDRSISASMARAALSKM